MSSQDVLDLYKLDSDVLESHIAHRTFTSDPSRGIRRIEQNEKWYRKQRLDNGGFAEVFLEEEKEKAQLRAVKEIRKDRLPLPGYDYLREVLSMILSSDETYFPKLFGWFEYDEKLCIAMEYFPLGDLTEIVSGPLAEVDTKSIVTQLAEALEILQTKQITHRDIKPQNVFVCKGPPQWWVKLGDFGISKRVQGDDTCLHTSIGSGCYIAPEVFGSSDKQTPYTSAVDMWSLGCVIFWLSTGKTPLSIWKQALRGKPTIRKDLKYARLDPAGLDVLQSCLDLEPEKRIKPGQLVQSEWLQNVSKISGQIGDRPPASLAKSLGEFSALADDSDQHESTRSLIDRTRPGQELLVNSGHADEEVSQKDSERRLSLNTNLESSQSLRDLLPVGGWYTLLEKPDEASQSLALKKIQALIGKGYDFPYSENGKSVIHLAAQYGLINLVEHVRSLGRDVKAKDNKGWTAIHSAAQGGHVAMIDHLISLGLDVKAKSNAGKTAIHSAAQGGHVAMIDHLISLGLNVKAKDTDGKTAIHTAAWGGHVAMIDHLISLGLNVKAKDNDGETAIHTAARGGYIALINRLISLALDVKAKDNDGETAIHIAAYRGHVAIIDRLISLGLDVKAKDTDGETAIHTAARGGHIAMIDHLISLGLDVKAKDNDGWTAIHSAALRGHVAMIRHLYSLGVNVTLKCSGGETAADIAKLNSQPEASQCIKKLIHDEKNQARGGLRKFFSTRK